MKANTYFTTDAQHRDPDHTIDRALSALRDAQPRPGLEGRILISLEHRSTTPGDLPFHQVKGWGSKREITRRITGIALWAATSAAILAVASLIILHHPTPPTKSARAPQKQLHSDTANSAQVRVSAIKSPGVSTQPAHSIRRHPERSAAQRRSSVFEDAQITPTPNAATTTPTDAQLLADLHAPSHPPKPLPLTPQEKLFLRMVRYANTIQLAELNPAVRAQHDADETTAFKAFFPDPPPLQQPNGDTE